MSNTLCCTRVHNGKIVTMLWRGTEKLKNIRDNDYIVVYEVPKRMGDGGANATLFTTSLLTKFNDLRTTSNVSTLSIESTESVESVDVDHPTENNGLKIISTASSNNSITNEKKKRRRRRKDYNVIPVYSLQWKTPILIDLPSSMSISSQDLYSKVIRRMTFTTTTTINNNYCKDDHDEDEDDESNMNINSSNGGSRSSSSSSSSSRSHIHCIEKILLIQQKKNVSYKITNESKDIFDESHFKGGTYIQMHFIQNNNKNSYWCLPKIMKHHSYDSTILSYNKSKEISLKELINNMEKEENVEWKCPSCSSRNGKF
jgi:hypothetical protein